MTFTAGTVTADTVQTFYVRVTDVTTRSGDATVTVTIRDIPTVTTYYDDMFSIGGAVALYRMNSAGDEPSPTVLATPATAPGVPRPRSARPTCHAPAPPAA